MYTTSAAQSRPCIAAAQARCASAPSAGMRGGANKVGAPPRRPLLQCASITAPQTSRQPHNQVMYSHTNQYNTISHRISGSARRARHALGRCRSTHCLGTTRQPHSTNKLSAHDNQLGHCKPASHAAHLACLSAATLCPTQWWHPSQHLGQHTAVARLTHRGTHAIASARPRACKRPHNGKLCYRRVAPGSPASHALPPLSTRWQARCGGWLHAARGCRSPAPSCATAAPGGAAVQRAATAACKDGG